MTADHPADPGRFVQALHDEARRGAAALGYDLCSGRPPDDAPALAWAHHDYHRLAREHGAICSRSRLILGPSGGRLTRPRRWPKPKPPGDVPPQGPGRPPGPIQRRPIPWWDLDAIAALGLTYRREHGRWPGPGSGPLGSGRTWADLAVYLRRRHGATLEGFLDARFPGMRGKG